MKTKKTKVISQVHHDRLTLQRLIPLTTPFVIYVEPSGYCNLKCVFCPHGIKGTTVLKKDLMSVKLFKKLVDDLSMFPDRIKLLRFSGTGEPLMNKNIVKMLQYAQEQNVAKRIELITNGILLTTDLIKNLPSLLDRIIISIGGLCPEDYQRISGTKIDFQNLLENLSNLYSHRGKCIIHIKTHNEVIHSKREKTKFLDIFSDHCDEIYIETITPIWPQLETTYRYRTNKFRFGEKKKVKKRQVCPQIFKSLQIQADGEVLPCCVDWKRINLLGNINKGSLFKIWNGKTLRKLQIEHLIGNKDKIEPCKNCIMNEYSEIDNIDSYADKLYKKLINK